MELIPAEKIKVEKDDPAYLKAAASSSSSNAVNDSTPSETSTQQVQLPVNSNSREYYGKYENYDHGEAPHAYNNHNNNYRNNPHPNQHRNNYYNNNRYNASANTAYSSNYSNRKFSR